MEPTAYYQSKRAALTQALTGLQEMVHVDLASKSAFEVDVYQNATVQKFEYSIELFWKVGKLFLSLDKGIEEASPRGVIKALYRHLPLAEELYDQLMRMVTHRNLLSHLYDSAQFQEIVSVIPSHSAALMKAAEHLPVKVEE